MVSETGNGAGNSEGHAAAEPVAALETTPATRPSGRSGRTRPPEEIERAKKSAALTRRVIEDAAILREAALAALKVSEGKGPAMAGALASEIERVHGVKFAKPAVRTMLLRLEKKGILKSRKVGTAYEWTEGSGRAARAVKKGPGRPAKAAGKPAKAPRANIKLKGKAGRPRAFKGTDAADRLIHGLSLALGAAEELRAELASVGALREQVQDIVKALRGR